MDFYSLFTGDFSIKNSIASIVRGRWI